jgi:Flp pilus assembly protein TadG
VRREAATTVEFAVVASAFFIFVLGIIEVGRGIMVAHLLTNAARVGCRVGTVPNQTTAQITTAVVNILNRQGIKSEITTVQVNDGVADASTAKSGDEITVIVSVPVSKITWLPGGSYLKGSLSGQFSLKGSLSGQFSLRRE